jgi:hypothetical protein
MPTYFSLIFDKGTPAEVEVPLKFHKGFNPYAHLPTPRVIVQRMLGGVNIQDSGCVNGDGSITISGVEMGQDTINLLNLYYLAAAFERRPFIYRSTFTESAQEWQAVWKSFIPRPYLVIPEMACEWTIELYILGKVGTSGELIP